MTRTAILVNTSNRKNEGIMVTQRHGTERVQTLLAPGESTYVLETHRISEVECKPHELPGVPEEPCGFTVNVVPDDPVDG